MSFTCRAVALSRAFSDSPNLRRHARCQPCSSLARYTYTQSLNFR